jgi:hypothetical protein
MGRPHREISGRPALVAGIRGWEVPGHGLPNRVIRRDELSGVCLTPPIGRHCQAPAVSKQALRHGARAPQFPPQIGPSAFEDSFKK